MAKKTESAAPESSPAPPIPKTEAVRRALQAGKTKPREGVEWIKTELGMDVTPEYFSTTKSAIAPAGKGKGAVSAPKGKAKSDGGIDGLMEDLAALKRLKERLGKDEVRKLLD